MGADAPDRNEPVQAFLSLVRVWFRDYKLPDGKPPNEFAFEGAYLPKSRAIAVVSEQHELWRALAARDHSTAATAQGKAYNGFWWGSPAAIPA